MCVFTIFVVIFLPTAIVECFVEVFALHRALRNIARDVKQHVNLFQDCPLFCKRKKRGSFISC